MLRKVEIVDNGDSNYVNGETAEYAHVVADSEAPNDQVKVLVDQSKKLMHIRALHFCKI